LSPLVLFAGLQASIAALEIVAGRHNHAPEITARNNAKAELDRCANELDHRRETCSELQARAVEQPQVQCFIGYTSSDLHDAIRANLHQSPLYSGKIKGIGPRYCPSIEDKVVKFADKDRHQLFLEPEGQNTNEVYLNGFSTSLPSALQLELLRMIEGFEKVEIIRPGYAIEYDFVDPRELRPTMESTRCKGLFLAGQINGTTGYEEAACQGLMAGINAALAIEGREPLVLDRSEAYIGVLVSDLIQHGVDEPYRLFTSRAEDRLSLRHDTADRRLSPKGRDIGLVGDSDWERFNSRRDRIAGLRNALDLTRFTRSAVEYATVSRILGVDLGDAFTLGQLAVRPGVERELVHRLLPEAVRSGIQPADLDTALADSLYSGYIEKQRAASERVNHHDSLKVPADFQFTTVGGLSHEMIERLERARPKNFAQVRSIAGLTPAAVSAVLVHLTSHQSFSTPG
jgi:tRNA uridine 5-carboxymethylaminomethyl modification enzyme